MPLANKTTGNCDFLEWGLLSFKKIKKKKYSQKRLMPLIRHSHTQRDTRVRTHTHHSEYTSSQIIVIPFVIAANIQARCLATPHRRPAAPPAASEAAEHKGGGGCRSAGGSSFGTPPHHSAEVSVAQGRGGNSSRKRGSKERTAALGEARLLPDASTRNADLSLTKTVQGQKAHSAQTELSVVSLQNCPQCQS